MKIYVSGLVKVVQVVQVVVVGIDIPLQVKD
jgi:hypothetical protein